MKRIAVILAILALAISVKANYSIYDFTGHVVLIQGGRQIKPEKGMKVMPTDEIEIAPGAKVEIYNEKTKEIFASVSDGKKSVMGIMLDARHPKRPGPSTTACASATQAAKQTHASTPKVS